MNTSKSLDEILKDFLDDTDHVLEVADDAPLDDPDFFDRPLIEAKKAIVEAVEGLIGPDEEVKPWLGDAGGIRNIFRAELRQAIKEWQ